jgi:hypothetical protein
MATRAKKPVDESITIAPLRSATIEAFIVGERLICNRMSEKARRQILLPSGRKTATERASTLKHDPPQEFRDSPYRMPNGETLLCVPGGAFKSALVTAAGRTPEVTKASIEQLVSVPDDYVRVWGVPEMLMSVTRSADIARTPDIRSRAILRKWCARLTIKFVTPLRPTAILTLLANAGIVSGIGDWRQEKGAGSYGSFVVVHGPKDDHFQAIVRAGGRKAQEAAMQDPHPYDMETEDMLAWFHTESKRRGFGDTPKAPVDEPEEVAA